MVLSGRAAAAAAAVRSVGEMRFLVPFSGRGQKHKLEVGIYPLQDEMPAGLTWAGSALSVLPGLLGSGVKSFVLKQYFTLYSALRARSSLHPSVAEKVSFTARDE